LSPKLTRIFIYPIKSLDPVPVQQTTILKSGPLKGDRAFALLDEKGNFVNGKRHGRIHLLRSSFDLDLNQLTIQIQDREEKAIFHLYNQQPELETWFSNYFNFPVRLVENQTTGFPDDPVASGPTIISTATLETVASWFPPLTVEDMRKRFRSNLEIDGVPAFWEDGLFAEPDEPLEFKLGEVLFQGINPCQRCIVPTRDALTGEPLSNFQKIFIARRQQSLPPWVNKSRFNHFYRLGVNTIIPEFEAGKILSIGDNCEIVG